MSTTARRRRFTAKHKLEVLHKADACTKPGEIGALLRSEGLYSSHLTMRIHDEEIRQQGEPSRLSEEQEIGGDSLTGQARFRAMSFPFRRLLFRFALTVGALFASNLFAARANAYPWLIKNGHTG